MVNPLPCILLAVEIRYLSFHFAVNRYNDVITDVCIPTDPRRASLIDNETVGTMATLISVASGKGGVGKSVVSANLALALAKSGRHVILAHLDVGGADAHIMFGELMGG